MKINLSTRLLSVIAAIVVIPISVFAQASGSGLRTINDVTAKFIDLGNTFLDVLIAFAVIWIIFNVVRYLIVGADSEEKRATARQSIIWGVIGLAIVLSIWGLVNIVLKTFVFNDNNAPVQSFPSIPTRNGSTGGSRPGNNSIPSGGVQRPPYDPGPAS